MGNSDIERMINDIPIEQRALISAANDSANPDIDGDLMRELRLRGVEDAVLEFQDKLKHVMARRRGRSRFVQGWKL